MILVTTDLRARLEGQFPRNATCWSQATDEVRDMCRRAREIVGHEDHTALNFGSLWTPSDWNRRGIDRIISYYDQMDQRQREQFCDNHEEWLSSWAA